MKFDWFAYWMGASTGVAFMALLFLLIATTSSYAELYVWKKAVKAGVAVQVDGEYEFIKEKK